MKVECLRYVSVRRKSGAGFRWRPSMVEAKAIFRTDGALVDCFSRESPNSIMGFLAIANNIVNGFGDNT
jgi:hypothetical protein